ncbi:MAG: FtsX-like permease family protein [Spirochaetaceae bacterium]|nr:FtsX-like permease family protein [Spirochaetaceae bacterium]
MNLWRIALRNVARNKRRSLLSGTAIAVATLAVVLLFSMIAGMLGDTVSIALTYDTGHVQVRHPEFGRYEHLSPVHLAVANAAEVQARLEQLPAVAAVLPRVRFGGAVYREDQNHAVYGIGVDFDREIATAARRLPHLAPAAGTAAPGLEDFARVWRLDLFGGALPDPAARELVMSKTLADELGVAVGDKLTILTRTAVMSTQAWTFRVSGLVGFPVGGLSRVVLLPIGVAQTFLQLDASGAVTDLLLYTEHDDQVPALAEAVRDAVGDRLEVRSWTEENAMYRLFQLATRIYDIIALVFFLLATTVIVNTTMMVVYERMREIGTIAALGMTGAQITRLFFLEALFIGVAAALVGVGLGIALVVPLSQVGIDYTEAMEGVELNMSNIIYPQLNLRSTVLVLCYSIAVTAAASFWPTRRAARLHPVTALRAT